jgi:proteic killer suppression protein
MAIINFTDKATEHFFYRETLSAKVGWKNLSNVAKRKLDMLHYAHALIDLKSPPGNRLEELKGKLHGHHSIRINDQWRIVFKWTHQGPSDVRIVDYH